MPITADAAPKVSADSYYYRLRSAMEAARHVRNTEVVVEHTYNALLETCGQVGIDYFVRLANEGPTNEAPEGQDRLI